MTDPAPGSAVLGGKDPKSSFLRHFYHPRPTPKNLPSPPRKPPPKPGFKLPKIKPPKGLSPKLLPKLFKPLGRILGTVPAVVLEPLFFPASLNDQPITDPGSPNWFGGGQDESALYAISYITQGIQFSNGENIAPVDYNDGSYYQPKYIQGAVQRVYFTVTKPGAAPYVLENTNSYEWYDIDGRPGERGFKATMNIITQRNGEQNTKTFNMGELARVQLLEITKTGGQPDVGNPPPLIAPQVIPRPQVLPPTAATPKTNPAPIPTSPRSVPLPAKAGSPVTNLLPLNPSNPPSAPLQPQAPTLLSPFVTPLVSPTPAPPPTKTPSPPPSPASSVIPPSIPSSSPPSPTTTSGDRTNDDNNSTTLDNIVNNGSLPPALALAPSRNPNVTQTRASSCSSGTGRNSCSGRTLSNTQDLKDKMNDLFNRLNGLNLGLNASQSATLDTINKKLGDQLTDGLSGNLGRLWDTLKVDRILNILSAAGSLHNAYHLSSDIGLTLFSIVDNVAQTVGLSWQDADGNTIGLGELVSNGIQALVVSIIGAENYVNLSVQWAKANRIYQASVNVLDEVRDIGESSRELAETTLENTGKIGNALRDNLVVSEDSYQRMPEETQAVTGFQKRFDKIVQGLEQVDDALSTLESVTSNIVDIKNSSKELAEGIKDWKDAVNTTQTEEEALRQKALNNLNLPSVVTEENLGI